MVEADTKPAFAVWITGLPSSGKSTLARAVAGQLADRGIHAAVLESDALRRILTPRPTYSDDERDVFYQAMVYVGKLLVEHGVPVIFDATANRRSYRDRARRQMARFLEVYVDCPLAVCKERDAKGIYRKAQEGTASTVPGLQAAYETPEHPALVVHGDRELPTDAARRVVTKLIEKGYVDNNWHPT
ncbi:MAG: adenylyl-sulfate kinase [Acidobacteria bacterium]|nr:adenylyl-sulfate kinase [Acidobacteriota bacterium]